MTADIKYVNKNSVPKINETILLNTAWCMTAKKCNISIKPPINDQSI